MPARAVAVGQWLPVEAAPELTKATPAPRYLHPNLTFILSLDVLFTVLLRAILPRCILILEGDATKHVYFKTSWYPRRNEEGVIMDKHRPPHYIRN